MSSVTEVLSGDAFPPEAIEAFRRTRPWLLFVAIATAILAAATLSMCSFFVLMISKAQNVSNEVGPLLFFMLAEFMFVGFLEAILATLQFRFAAGLSTLAATEARQASAGLDLVCRRQLQLWAGIAIFSGVGLILGLIYLVELAAHAPW